MNHMGTSGKADSTSVGLGRDPSFCVSEQLLGSANAADSLPALGTEGSIPFCWNECAKDLRVIHLLYSTCLSSETAVSV